MERDALQYLVEELNNPTEIIEHNGLKYSSRDLFRVPEVAPKPFATKSLASIVELVTRESKHPRLNPLVIHVAGPTKVNVYSELRDDLDRFHLYTAEAELPRITLGSFIDLEQMNIMLKSTFVPTEARDALIALLGGIKEDNVRTSTDDGISQTVTAKAGIATVANVTVPPIVKLAPFRTFNEVSQPEGEFLLRLRQGPVAALFEADGGAWTIQARKNIKEYFLFELEDLIDAEKLIITE
ncbi:MAG TPA: hypothetical protein GX523_10695 [Desulfitobacterium dehalogenans]|uniref:Uncharacterized protein n=1 Tax=Desulfitobacterium dehalogenans TaxID=36854 RepID=A0A7C6Z4R1_9FIRM|nr:hypothetical protein [Desulfitobacterium dehalogenans]